LVPSSLTQEREQLNKKVGHTKVHRNTQLNFTIKIHAINKTKVYGETRATKSTTIIKNTKTIIIKKTNK
jgi:hypothetical protein